MAAQAAQNQPAQSPELVQVSRLLVALSQSAEALDRVTEALNKVDDLAIDLAVKIQAKHPGPLPPDALPLR